MTKPNLPYKEPYAKQMKSSRKCFSCTRTCAQRSSDRTQQVCEKQLSDYCRSETFLKGRDVDELAAFLNTPVMKKTEEYLPLWNACIRGSCGTNPEGDKTATNIIALATATATRHRVKDLSALHFRIPTLLSHGGISFEGAVWLNRLGI